jgi:hypothetical protein
LNCQFLGRQAFQPPQTIIAAPPCLNFVPSSSSAVSFLDPPRAAAMLVAVMRSNAQPNQIRCKNQDQNQCSSIVRSPHVRLQ